MMDNNMDNNKDNKRDIDWDNIDLQRVIKFDPKGKYLLIFDDDQRDNAEFISAFLANWIHSEDQPFAILFGDFIIVRVDRLPPRIADKLGV